MVWQRVLFTSKKPSRTLTTMRSSTLDRAASGVKRVNTDVMTTPTPNTHFPPNLVASHPPGICVRA